MTPTEFKAARQRLGLTAAALAHILAVGTRAVQSWEAETGSRRREPPPTACRVMEWMLAGYRPPEWPTPRSKPGHRRNDKTAMIGE